jgi:integrase
MCSSRAGARRPAARLCRCDDLRHACASYLAAGVDLKTVQSTLRHQPATTERYLHALQEVPRAAAAEMDEMDTVPHRTTRESVP